jgi:hypothetical protein
VPLYEAPSFNKGNTEMKHFYECGICGAWHDNDWHGDCREDAARFTLEEIEAEHGEEGIGWIEVPMCEEQE